VAFDRGFDFAELHAEVPVGLLWTLTRMLWVSSGHAPDILVLFADDWSILAWIPVTFQTTSATGQVLVLHP